MNEDEIVPEKRKSMLGVKLTDSERKKLRDRIKATSGENKSPSMSEWCREVLLSQEVDDVALVRAAAIRSVLKIDRLWTTSKGERGFPLSKKMRSILESVV